MPCADWERGRRAVGFTGGANGENLIARLGATGDSSASDCDEATTRVNLAIVDERGAVTEILNRAAHLPAKN